MYLGKCIKVANIIHLKMFYFYGLIMDVRTNYLYIATCQVHD